jgi:hypothetical protein
MMQPFNGLLKPKDPYAQQNHVGLCGSIKKTLGVEIVVLKDLIEGRKSNG